MIDGTNINDRSTTMIWIVMILIAIAVGFVINALLGLGLYKVPKDHDTL
jgi:hypothetical protein